MFSKNELDLQIQSGKSYVTATGDRIAKFVLSDEFFLNFLSAALLAHAFDCAS